MKTKAHVHLETLAVHAGQPVDPATGAVVPPISLATTFEREADGTYPRGFSYSRSDNPNRRALEECIAALEDAKHAIAFSSGLGAANAIIHALNPGDHVVATQDVYHGVRKSLDHAAERHLLEVSFVDTTNLEAIRGAIHPHTRLLWLETPSNPLLKITDLGAASALARQHGVLTLCDGTLATPILQSPLRLGVDMVLHSTTKYIAGHSDVVGGILVANEMNPLLEEALLSQRAGGGGGVPSPFDCWLTLRGVATLPLRIRAQSASALQIAHFLAEHPQVEQVFYPGLPHHPGHELAARQMKMFGAIISFLPRGSKGEALAVTGRLNIITRATSLGGTHSLIEHRASIEGPKSSTPQNLLRLSIGLENTADLIDDLQASLRKR